MDTNELILADEFCTYYHIDYSFINSLQESNLIELITIEEKHFIPAAELQNLEKYVRLHYDLQINIEGIETVVHLLERVKNLQQENSLLRNRLRLLEL